MPELNEYAIKTYRTLRLAMVTVLVMLAAAVLFEWWQTDESCWQTSISAYYYTPVQAVFVGALIALGASMVALRGNNDPEDALLNVGGMLALVVALVPTPGMGTCRSVDVTLRDTPADIENNISALAIAGIIGLVMTYIISRLAAKAREPASVNWQGLAFAGLITISGIAWFILNPGGFRSGAHYTAAITMFVCIVAVVALNAVGLGRKLKDKRVPNPFRNRYTYVAVAMVLSAACIGLWKWLVGWDHAVLWIEGTLIALFAYFWTLQTQELWHEGVPDAQSPRSEVPSLIAALPRSLGKYAARKNAEG